MPYRIEFAEASERDLDLIFDHLFESYLGFGESTDQAFDHAAQRIMSIRAAAERLALFPERGASRDDILPGLRFMVMERAIYWFDVDERAQAVRVLGIFFGGQDHIRRMLIRLLGTDPPASRKD
ncbi:MAG: type II toxin-antitoxin system RelE/ParE family toxin [Roseomonas sp.]|nr:type II toxin-antitoxin system RelE/ParE family toxin [Roseomonas sp.]